MDKSSISIDLGDPRTSLVAEALSNKTCVKILNLLTDEELTASDISQKLDVPLNTIGYNLEKLIAAGLVEKSRKFFWSVKGKKTPVYKLANKKIVISPKKMMKGVLPAFLITGALVVLALLIFLNNSNNIVSYNSNSNELTRFNSYNEFADYIQKSNFADTTANYFERNAMQAESADSGSDASPSFKSGGYAADYSQTNIQVEGVDELDIVKNDGRYIYTANQNKVSILDAYPAENMSLVAELDFDNYVTGIFIEDNKLVVVESSYGYINYGFAAPEIADSSKVSILPPATNKAEVKVHVYDVQDGANSPKLLNTFVVDGNYQAARLIGDKMYVISNKYIESKNPDLPSFGSNGNVKTVEATDIYYPIVGSSNVIFTSVMAIDLSNLEYKGDVFLTGASSVSYISKNAIYFTNFKSYDYSEVQDGILQITVDALPSDLKSEAQDIIESDSDFYIKSEQLNLLLAEQFNKLNAQDKEDFQNSLSEKYSEYYKEISKKYERTILHKVNIDGLDISYGGSGEVPGYIINQFSIDEKDGYLRIATTTGNAFGGFDKSLNHLYVLNDNLEIVGSVENLAEGEQIYSSRFVDDKLYLVTFRQTDPLYVIDISHPKNPQVLGYLKVTGFSNYLHPIGNNLLLGIGREATEDGRAKGLKISLFDVSEFDNPKELDKYLVESEWSYSEAEYEHKAVLFDDKKDLLVIPVTYSKQSGQNWQYWQGAFVFNVTDNDISLKGKISHDIENKKVDDYYGPGQGYVQRSLFIDNNLYTVSDILVKANNLNTLKDISSVKLNYTEPIYIVY